MEPVAISRYEQAGSSACLTQMYPPEDESSEVSRCITRCLQDRETVFSRGPFPDCWRG